MQANKYESYHRFTAIVIKAENTSSTSAWIWKDTVVRVTWLPTLALDERYILTVFGIANIIILLVHCNNFGVTNSIVAVNPARLGEHDDDYEVAGDMGGCITYSNECKSIISMKFSIISYLYHKHNVIGLPGSTEMLGKYFHMYLHNLWCKYYF